MPQRIIVSLYERIKDKIKDPNKIYDYLIRNCPDYLKYKTKDEPVETYKKECWKLHEELSKLKQWNEHAK